VRAAALTAAATLVAKRKLEIIVDLLLQNDQASPETVPDFCSFQRRGSLCSGAGASVAGGRSHDDTMMRGVHFFEFFNFFLDKPGNRHNCRGAALPLSGAAGRCWCIIP